MATLLNGVSANGAGSGASHSGPCTVFVHGTFDGATVVIQGSDADTDAKYSRLDRSILPQDKFQVKGNCAVQAYGTYYLRAVVSNAGSSTSITVVTTQ